MAMSPEEKAAKQIARIMGGGLKRRLIAAFLIDEMTFSEQAQFFDFMMHCIDMFSKDDMLGTVDMDRAERNLLSIAIKEAIRNEGYRFRE